MIAAGGTGGHLFPAQSLALDLREKHPDINITFVGAGLGGNDYFKKGVFPYLDIKSGTPFKKHPIKLLKALLKLFQGTVSCLRFFSKKKPDVIVGFGSFHTFPAILAAKIRKVPIVIFESNALPGKVNRFCSKWAIVSAIQFSHASKYLRSKSVCVQMPISKKEEPTKNKRGAILGFKGKSPHFLFLGDLKELRPSTVSFARRCTISCRKGWTFKSSILSGKKRGKKKSVFIMKI